MQIFKLLMLFTILTTSTFAATNNLLKHKESEGSIIDIGYKQAKADYPITIQKEWIETFTVLKDEPSLIHLESREINNFDCEVDELGHENCPIQSSQCDASVQYDKGIATLQERVKTRGVSMAEVTSCTENSYTKCETETKAQTIYFTLYYDSTPSGSCDKVKVTAAHPIGSTYGWKTGLTYSNLATRIIQYAGISVNSIISQGSLLSWAQTAWRNYSGSCGRGTIHGPAYIPITANVTIKKKFYCPSDYKIYGSNGNYVCEKEYKYYSYSCDIDSNIYDQPWIGPVKSAGGDCNGQCGPFGCVCSVVDGADASIPPDGNCQRGFWTCPAGDDILCTRDTNTNDKVENVIGTEKFDSGFSITHEKTLTKEKICPQGGTYNVMSKLCEAPEEIVCLNDDFSYSDTVGKCIKSIQCDGIIDSNGFCNTETEKTCLGTFSYDSVLQECVSSPICDSGSYDLAQNKCIDNTLIYTPACPTNSVFSPTQDKCVKTPEQKCSGDMELISSNILGSSYVCKSSTDNSCTGERGYILSKEGVRTDFCAEDNSVTCPADYNPFSGKCVAFPTCESGYLLGEDSCQISYKWNEYQCTDSTPVESGVDCLGSCNFDGCSCNPITPPATNCKTPAQGNNIVELNQSRDIELHNVLNEGMSLLEFGTSKGFGCGKECLFNVNEINTENGNLCFSKRNGQKECFNIQGCHFSGSLKVNKELEEITVSNYNTLTSEEATGSITSTCKLNGHVGWANRIEGITSIKAEGDRLLFWDSYSDGYLGFIEFVRDIPSDAREDNFIYENPIPYEMLTNRFTSIEKLSDITYFVGEDISRNECIYLANREEMNVLVSPSNAENDLLKTLSGDNALVQSVEPDCNGEKEGFSPTNHSCVQPAATLNNSCSTGEYLVEAPTSNSTLRDHGIWKGTGDFFEATFSLFVKESDVYTFNLLSGGQSAVALDAATVQFASISNQRIKEDEVYLTKGYHTIRLRASKNVLAIDNLNSGGWNTNAQNYTMQGERSVGLFILDKEGYTIFSTKDYKGECYIPPVTSCSNFSGSNIVLTNEVCLAKSNPICRKGTYNSVTEKCDIFPKCILTKFGDHTFKAQNKALKITRKTSGDIIYKCSPLKCSNNQCAIASCTNNLDGEITIDKLANECRDDVCDGKLSFNQYCGKETGCDDSDPLVFMNSNNECKRLTCPEGSTLNIQTKKCEKLSCPEGTFETIGGACIKQR